MSRPTAKVTNRYIAKTYDRLNLIIPMGRKADCDAYASAHGTSLNGLVNELLREKLGMTLEEWKCKPDGVEEGE